MADVVRSCAFVVVLAAVGTGCVQSSSVPCGDGVCPAGTTCVEPNFCKPLTCGDGEFQPVEACDDASTVPGDCTDHGFYQPDGLACGVTCQLDTSACRERCGDHVTNGPESCDGLPPSGESCIDYGRDLGPLGCAPGCSPDLRGCGTIGWQPGEGTAPGKLLSIWGTDLENLYAVGDLGTIVRRVNGEWTTVPSTIPATTLLNAVWGSAPDRAFAVGVDTIDGSTTGTIVALVGQSWNPSVTVAAELTAIDGDGTIAYAVGANGTILRNDGGTTWTPELVSPPTPLRFFGVYARGGIAVGDGGIVYRRGSDDTWRPVTGLPALVPTLTAVTGAGTGATATVIAVGANGTVIEFDGSTWTRKTAPPLGALPGSPDLVSVWLAGPRDAFIGGGRGVVYRYDGTVFVDTRPGTTRVRSDVFGLDPEHVFAISGGKVLEFDGSIRRAQLVDAAPAPRNIRAVTQIGPRDWLAGTDTDTAATPSTARLLRSNDGSTWKPYSTAFGPSINAIWRDGDHLAIAGAELHYSVAGLAGFGLRSPTGVAALAGRAGDVYAAGNGIHHCTDPSCTTWADEVPADADPAALEFTGVWSAGNGVAFAVGDAGTILRRAATGAWTRDDIDLVDGGTFLFGVWGTAPDNVYVVGNQGLLLRFDGTAWRRIPLDTVDNLHAVEGTSPSNVVVVGAGGSIFHFDGATWSPVRNPSTTTCSRSR